MSQAFPDRIERRQKRHKRGREMIAERCPVWRIAEELRVSCRTVYRWRHLTHLKSSGRKRVATEDNIRLLREIVLRHPREYGFPSKRKWSVDLLLHVDKDLAFLGRTQMYALIERENIDLRAFATKPVYREVPRTESSQRLPKLQGGSTDRSIEDLRAEFDEKILAGTMVLGVHARTSINIHFELVHAVYNVKIDQHTLDKAGILSAALENCSNQDEAAGRAEIQKLIAQGFTSLKADPPKGTNLEEHIKVYIKEHHHDVQAWRDYQSYGLGPFDPTPYAKRAECIVFDWGGRTDDGGTKLAHEILERHEYLRGLERRDLIKEIRGVTWRQLD